MSTSSRSGGATGVALAKVFGLLGLILSLLELFVSSPLSIALKCARQRSSKLLMSFNRLPSWSLQKEAGLETFRHTERILKEFAFFIPAAMHVNALTLRF